MDNFLFNLISDNIATGGMTPETSDKVEILCNKYKQPTLAENTTIISADFGLLGSIVARRVVAFDEAVTFKYERGDYDYINIEYDNEIRILWTDYKDIEPYNRNGGLYCKGSSFESFGEPVKETPEYREFYAEGFRGNVSYGVGGYKYNKFSHSVSFDLCVLTDKVADFISELRQLIGK